MAAPQVCCFCLGGETDVPSFGELKDGADFVLPCATCSLQSHRKCLLDWFNSLPSDKLQIVDPQAVHETLISRGNAVREEPRYEIYLSSQSVREWLSQMWGAAAADTAASNSDAAANENDNNLATNDLSNATANNASTDNLNTNSTSDAPASDATTGNFNNIDASPDIVSLTNPVVFLLAPCPQCKSDIVFSMKRSALLSANSNSRHLLVRTLSFGGLFLGFTSAVTGVVSMAYIGLTSCGLKMMDCLIPGPLLVSMLTKRTPSPGAPGAYTTLSQLLLGNANNYAIDNLEQALYKGLIDPLKFSRIPLLPVMLYRMRGSSITECLFGRSKDKMSHWITEFLINGYISSLGNHELARRVAINAHRILTSTLADPSSISLGFDLFRGVDFWKTSNMISLLIPIRWTYDVFSRLLLNKAHFDLTLRIRPREITNSLPPADVEVLEELNDKLRELERSVQHKRSEVHKQLRISSSRPHSLVLHLKKRILFVQSIVTSNIPLRYIRLTLANWWYKLKACLNNDYSTTLLSQSTMIRCFSTLVWPYVSSKVGAVVLHTVLGKMVLVPNVPHEKLVLLSNMVGLVAVVFAKDLTNLYLSYKKAGQLSNMRILTSYSPPIPKKEKKTSSSRLTRLNTNAVAAYNRFFGTESSEEYPLTEESGDEEYQDTETFPGGYPAE